MTKRITIRLPVELLARARQKAAAEGCTLTSLIEDGLRLAIAHANPEKSKRVMPRVSRAAGGPMPGFEDNPHRAAQELEDMQYVERMKRSFR